MWIESIALYRNNEPLKYQIPSLHGTRLNPESIIVELTFSNKVSGYGESTPRFYVTGETCASVIKVVQKCFAPIMFRTPVNTFSEVNRLLNELERVSIASGIGPFNSALGAIDMAMLDALGKSQAVNIAEFIGPPTRTTIPYSISIPILPPADLKKIISSLFKTASSSPATESTTRPIKSGLGMEFQHFKIILSASEDSNIRRTELIRNLMGDQVEIRFDANGKLSFEQVSSNLEKLRVYRISAIEQPAAKNDLDGLRKVRQTVEIPVIADESICSIADARTLIEKNACDVFNIKISKCGGLLRSLEIAKFAESQGIACQLGSHIGEAEILAAAGRSFAMTAPNLSIMEVGSFLLFDRQLGELKEMPKLNKDIDNDGLGISINSHILKKRYDSPIVIKPS